MPYLAIDPTSPPQHSLRLRLQALATSPVCLGLLTLSLCAAAGRGAENILPPSEVVGQAIYNPDGPGFIQVGDVDVPGDCGSSNLDLDYPGNNPTTWTVTSSVGSGSTVHVGRSWTVRAEINSFPATIGANDGIDPLYVRLPPIGPAMAGALPSGDILGGSFYYRGDDPIALIGTLGQWGFTYDVNSEPTIFDQNQSSDGLWVILEVTVLATAPGTIAIPLVTVEGYDNSVLEGEVDCMMDVGFQWTVVDPDPTAVGPDQATTDSTYANVNTGDANAGPHALNIDVLANDDDPNVLGGPGDLTQVRIQSWDQTSAQGGSVSCGSPGQQNPPASVPLSELSPGPCVYTPPVGLSGTDSFGYRARAATDADSSSVGVVTIALEANNRPIPGVPSFGTASGEDKVLDLEPYIFDGNSDPLTCFPAGAPIPNSVGSATVNADCTVTWDNTNPGFTGNVTFPFRVCDTHPTLDGGELGSNVDRAPGYSAGDLSVSTSRRCESEEATISILTGLKLPPTGVSDSDIVDAGYAIDGIGSFHLRIPVLDNDTDGNGPNPSMPSAAPAVLLPPDITQGTASFDAEGNLLFTPTDGYSGGVSLTYRVCEDPALQAPPYEDDPNTPLINEGLPICGVGAVNIQVIGNAPPIAGPDQASIAHDALLFGFDVGANDADPEGGALACTPESLTASDPALVELASLTATCNLSVNPTDGAMGTVVFTYEVCDMHALASPAHPAALYGDDGRAPGDAAPRCSVGETTIDVVMQDGDGEPDPHAGDPPPVCITDTAFTFAGQPISIPVLDNDSDFDADENPGSVILTGPQSEEPTTTALGGSAAKDGPTTILYTPPDDFVGTDTFEYFARDEIGQGCVGTVLVHGPTIVPTLSVWAMILLSGVLAIFGVFALGTRP